MKKIPQLVQRYHSQFIWRLPTEKPYLYLTFDDGPNAEITPWVLDTLEAYQVKASFFLLGKQVLKYPEIVHRTIDSGHVIGNHGFAHKDGWKTSLRSYLLDFVRARQTIYEYTGTRTRIFRPAYAHITNTKAKYILRSHKIVMMDIMSGDFDHKLTGEEVTANVIEHADAGSIILFHDSIQAFERLKVALPRVLDHFLEKGFEFKPLPVSRLGGSTSRASLTRIP